VTDQGHSHPVEVGITDYQGGKIRKQGIRHLYVERYGTGTLDVAVSMCMHYLTIYVLTDSLVIEPPSRDRLARAQRVTPRNSKIGGVVPFISLAEARKREGITCLEYPPSATQSQHDSCPRMRLQPFYKPPESPRLHTGTIGRTRIVPPGSRTSDTGTNVPLAAGSANQAPSAQGQQDMDTLMQMVISDARRAADSPDAGAAPADGSAAAPQVDAKDGREPVDIAMAVTECQAQVDNARDQLSGFTGNAGEDLPQPAGWASSADSPASGGRADIGGEEKQQVAPTPMSSTWPFKESLQQGMATHTPDSEAAAANSGGEESADIATAAPEVQADWARAGVSPASGGQPDIGGATQQPLLLTQPPNTNSWGSWSDVGADRDTIPEVGPTPMSPAWPSPDSAAEEPADIAAADPRVKAQATSVLGMLSGYVGGLGRLVYRLGTQCTEPPPLLGGDSSTSPASELEIGECESSEPGGELKWDLLPVTYEEGELTMKPQWSKARPSA
jgi:hypothetical protein